MALIPKNDVTQIFASQAPIQDTPAAFANYPTGWGVSRVNNGKPTIKQFNYIQQRTDQNILYIHQNGAALPYDVTMEYAENAIVVKDSVLQQWKSGAWFQLNKADAIIDASGKTQQEINNGLESIAELATIQMPQTGNRVYVKSYYSGLNKGGGTFVYDATKATINDGGLVINGWVRQHIMFVTPEMFGVVPDDATTSYGTKLNALFNCGFPILLGKSKYYSDDSIIVENKNISLQGVSKTKSRLVFKNIGHGLVQTTTTGIDTFDLHNCSITTQSVGTGNGSGFKYDASAYLATLPITGTGYKQLGNRSLCRGSISDLDLGSYNDTESNIGWGHALEFIGCMNFSVNGLYMRLPTDKSGNGVWIHGDGMPTDFHFNDVYSFGGNTVFRFNDYLEGFHLTNFELINCNRGLSSAPDSETLVSGTVRLLASYINSGHILAYDTCIAAQFLSSSKLYGLELYVWSDTALHPVSQGINIITCDSVQIYGSTVVNANPAANGTTLGIQLGTGWGNKVSGVTFKGQPWYAAIALGTNNTFYGNTVKDVTVDRSDTAILVNETNCSGNDIEAPVIVTSTNLALSLSSNVLSKNNISYRSSLFNATYTHTTDTTFTVDISTAKLTQVPVSIKVSEVAGVFGGVQYSYRRDASTKDLITIQTTATVTSPSSTNRGLFVEVFGV